VNDWILYSFLFIFMKTQSIVSWESCQSIICCQSEIDKLKLSLIQKENLEHIIDYSKLMSDKTRASIIYLIHIRWTLCVCDFANVLEMSSQAISSQLIKLHDKWILKKEKKWLTVFYSLLDKDFISYLKHIL